MLLHSRCSSFSICQHNNTWTHTQFQYWYIWNETAQHILHFQCSVHYFCHVFDLLTFVHLSFLQTSTNLNFVHFLLLMRMLCRFYFLVVCLLCWQMAKWYSLNSKLENAVSRIPCNAEARIASVTVSFFFFCIWKRHNS